MVVRRGIRSSAARIEISRTGIEIAGKIFISNVTTMTRRKIRGISAAAMSVDKGISAGGTSTLKATDLAAEILARYVSILTAWVRLLHKSALLV
jgi:hypothetical protein